MLVAFEKGTFISALYTNLHIYIHIDLKSLNVIFVLYAYNVLSIQNASSATISEKAPNGFFCYHRPC